MLPRHLQRGCVTAILTATLLAGCGGGDDDDAPSREKSPAETVTPSHCPSDLAGCRTTEGRIVFVERVDPDGDGDAHFVVSDPQGITAPGLTAIDVRKGLRPDPLPGPGDLISAAGPVQLGSFGQSQIHALELHVAAPSSPDPGPARP